MSQTQLNEIAQPETGTNPKAKTPQPQENGRMISLLNFDPEVPSRSFINSPRSLEALKRLCYDQSELLIKTAEDFIHEPVPNEFQNDRELFVELKVEHNERRRQEKIKHLIEERERVIIEQSKSVTSLYAKHAHQSSRHSEGNAFTVTDSVFEEEKKKINQMKNKQKKEIEFIIQRELKIEEMKKKQEEKNERIRELEYRKLIEQEERNMQNSEKQKKRQELKIRRDENIKVMKLEMEERRKRNEQMIKEKQDRLEEEREIVAIERENARKEKQIVRDGKIKKLAQDRKIYALQKQSERDEKSEKMRLEFEKRKEEKRLESELQRQEFEKKIEQAKIKVEMDRKLVKDKFNEKLIINEEKRIRMEEAKRNELDERRIRTEAKVKEIKASIQEKYKEEQVRKSAYLVRYKEAEENKLRKDLEIEEQRLLKISLEQEKERKRKQTILEHKKEKEYKNHQLLETWDSIQKQAEFKRNKLQHDKQVKYMSELLKLEDAAENNRRLQKVRERKQQAFLEKMAQDQERIEQIQREKEMVAMQKKLMAEQLQHEKKQVLLNFEKQKKKLANSKHQFDSAESFMEKMERSTQNSPARVGPSSNNYRFKPSNFQSPQPNTAKSSSIQGNATISHAGNTNGQQVSIQNSQSVPIMKPITKKGGNLSDLNGYTSPSKPQIKNNNAKNGGGKSSRKTPKVNKAKDLVNGPYNQNAQSQKYLNVTKSINREVEGNYDANDIISSLISKKYDKLAKNIRKQHQDNLIKELDQMMEKSKNPEDNFEENSNQLIGVMKKQQDDLQVARTSQNYLQFENNSQTPRK